MKKLITLSVFSLFVMLLPAQEKKELMHISLSTGEVVTYNVTEINSIHFEVLAAEDKVPEFPAGDSSPKLNAYDAQATAKSLLTSAGTACTNTMGKIVITTEEYNEIKKFTDDLVKNCATQKDIHETCFKWVYGNVKYGTEYSDGSYVNNDPYPVFTKKIAVCQGYSNLLFVMLHSQNVPVLITNGFLNGYGVSGGHAWNYVNCDGVWYVSDPTNNGIFNMESTSTYGHLFPQSFDVVLFKEQGCQFDLNETHLNISSVTTTSKYFVTPFSVGGYQVTSFNPTSNLPANVRELFIGKNIETFGINRVGLNYHGKNIEYIHVDPAHPTLCSNNGVVYEKGSNEPKYIPAGMKRMELLPMEKIGKNLVYGHNGVEEVVIAEGTKSIEAWAFENCPNLKVAYVPTTTTVDDKAFTGVHADFKIIRTE
ncbi:MAG: transglutaminase domain-containing protein [Bacteroidaceae bacterium]|nr:transglutaminase domain-containing protein [Bacteroidaceae bacterium]